MSSSRRAPVFMDAVLASSGADAISTPLKLAATLFMMVLTAAAAQISVPLPFTPVPFTFQPMVVLLGGAVLGPRAGPAQPGALSGRRPRGPAGLRGVSDAAAGPGAPARSHWRISSELPVCRVGGRRARAPRSRSALSHVRRRDGRGPRRRLHLRRPWLALFAPGADDALARRGARASGSTRSSSPTSSSCASRPRSCRRRGSSCHRSRD